ncbi:MAG: sugar ABC transporter substrate-binding protein [Pseudomonadota bacterium]|nr:sugar ABC transporter substrate-binding protein [Pseudomonadota bacterium]
MFKLNKLLAAALPLGLLCVSAVQAETLNIVTVNNGHMIKMTELSKEYEKANPGVELNWITLDEGTLRERVTTDIASKGGQFDVMTIGMYETPIWAKREWLVPIEATEAYDVDDILPAMRDGLSYDGKLYAAPFYGESSLLLYRKDLVEKAGKSIDGRPTWDQVKDIAAVIHNPDEGVYGICLRGRAGWGENMAFFGTLVNTFGGRWFDENWQPQINTEAWKKATEFYVDLLTNYGPPNSENNSFNEILKLTNEGKCGMWIDASIAASFVSDPKQGKYADQMAFAQTPIEKTENGANWLWAWALAIPASSQNVDEAQKFINWATSKEYIELVAASDGWASVPTGTRSSTYANDNFKSAAKFAEAEFTAIKSADPNKSTLEPVPYVGVQFVTIPEFQAIGNFVGEQIQNVLTGKYTADQALKRGDKFAERELKKAGYYK